MIKEFSLLGSWEQRHLDFLKSEGIVSSNKFSIFKIDENQLTEKVRNHIKDVK